MRPGVTIRQALSDPALLGNILAGASWRAWRVLLVAAMGEALTDDERAIFTKLTGRGREPLQRVEEMATVVGRRGGKSRAAATLAVYLGGLCHHDLAPGEKGVLLCIAPDQRQAAITLDYATAAFERSPILRQLVANRTADTLELTSGVSIEVRSASFRRLRGPTYIAVIADEAAFWYSDEFSANTDAEILNSVRPGLATTRGPLIIASSPYARTGVLWEMHRRHYGAAGDPLILVAQGGSRDFNPTLPQVVVDRALERDAAAASAEFLGQFRNDLASFINRELLEASIDVGVLVRPPVDSTKYFAFTDASGGVGDSFTLGIAHRASDGSIVLDLLFERRAPFNPYETTEEIVALLKTYHCTQVVGDAYGARWVSESFIRAGVAYRKSELDRSAVYLNALPLFTSGRARLIDNTRLIAQFAGLERRTFSTGRDRIDHGRAGRDDACNAAAGALVLAARMVAQRIPFTVLPDLSKSSQLYNAPNPQGIPQHYLAQPKPFVSSGVATSSWGAPAATRFDRWSNKN